MPTLITGIRRMNCPRISTVFVFIVGTAFLLLTSCDTFADVDQPPVNSSKVPSRRLEGKPFGYDQPPVNSSKVPSVETITSEDGSVITVTKDNDSGEILSKVLAVNSSVEVI